MSLLWVNKYASNTVDSVDLESQLILYSSIISEYFFKQMTKLKNWRAIATELSLTKCFSQWVPTITSSLCSIRPLPVAKMPDSQRYNQQIQFFSFLVNHFCTQFSVFSHFSNLLTCTSLTNFHTHYRPSNTHTHITHPHPHPHIHYTTSHTPSHTPSHTHCTHN